MLVLPTTMQPAAFIRATNTLSWVGISLAHKGLPKVLGKPSALPVSLMACGTPCSQPRAPGALRRGAMSASRASAWASSASSGARFTMALARGFSTWMRDRQACITSRHDTWRLRMAPDSASALQSQRGPAGRLMLGSVKRAGAATVASLRKAGPGFAGGWALARSLLRMWA
jgi:hypothetical protein